MSLQAAIIELIHQRGSATVDDIMPELAPEGYNRHEVIRAMQRTKFEGVLERDRNVGGSNRGGSRPAVYRISPNFQPPPPKARPKPLASVWELANPRELVPVWPPAFHGGRPYQLLWDEA